MKLLNGIFLILVCAALLIQSSPQKKILHNLPEPMSAETRSINIECLEKGKILYKINGSSCHGIFTKEKDSILNFTKDQRDNYRSAVLMAKDKTNHAVAGKMST